ncbi:MAG: DegT/DnrJ/EryC1/StrS family aminotransferase [Muribaculaceae bacterium]|nr:DegT/DnrJ/EryC1/StrS family aminotransferase [Muribaculaceae bacterium]
MKERILLCLAHMSGREMEFIKSAFDDNWVVPLGPNVNGFEEDLKRFVNHRLPSTPADSSNPSASGNSTPAPLHKEVVCLSAGTAAVHLALIACDVNPRDEVIVQTFTFCASSHPVTYLGATPVFVDSERETWNMDPVLLESAIIDRIEKTGRKPKAIIPVALYGMPYRIDRITAIAEKYQIPVIEDAAEGMGSRFNGQVLGTFGKFGVLSFNGNKMITTSGGGALICGSEEGKKEILFYATQARENYPYYQHERIGFNYRMSNICAGIGRGQMTILDEHIAHHKHVQKLYCELLADVDGIEMHCNPSPEFDSNFWLCTALLSPSLRIKGEENVYKEAVKGAVGGAAGVTHEGGSVTTECQPERNVEALRVALDKCNIESRPLWKPMHCQPVYANNPAYVNGVSEELFRHGICLPSGPWVSDEHVHYIVDCIKQSIVKN